MDLNVLLEWLALPAEVNAQLLTRYAGNTVFQFSLAAIWVLAALPLCGFVWGYIGRVARRVVGERLSEETFKATMTGLRGPVLLIGWGWLSAQSAMLLSFDPAAEPASDNYANLAVAGFFTTLAVLGVFWLGHRVARWIAQWLLNRNQDQLSELPESKYIPSTFRVLKILYWTYAVMASLTVAGTNLFDVVWQVLSFRVFGNAIYQYLAFTVLSSLLLLFARLILHQIEQLISWGLAKRGIEEANLQENWLSDLYRPLLYVLIAAGLRVASLVMNDYVDETAFSFYAVIATALDMALVFIGVWIGFIVTDKAFDHILIPLAEAGKLTFDLHIVKPFRNVAKLLILLVGLVLLIQAAGRDPAAVLAGMGVGGLAIGLAARDTLAPFISGIVLYATKPFKLGDLVTISDHLEGTVTDIDLRTTTIITPMGTRLIIPNDSIATAPIHNMMRKGKAYDGLFMRIDIATTPEKRDETIALFCRVINETQHAGDPEVHFLEYGSDNLGLMMTYWIDKPMMLWQIRTAIMLAIDSQLRDIGVEMSLPTAALNFHGYLPDGGIPTVRIQPLPGLGGPPVGEG